MATVTLKTVSSDAEASASSPVPSTSASDTPPHGSDWGQWAAHLNLTLARRPRGTRLIHNEHRGPLYVQKPFYPEGDDLAHVYILHPPGGLVSGDNLQIATQVGDSAHALLTTPGAGRVYRARQDRAWQHQHNRFTVGEQASLEWLPLETIIYPNARTRLQTTVELGENSRFIGWEVTSLGLPSCGLDMANAEVHQRFAVYRQGKPLFIERFQLDEQNRRLYAAKVGLQNNPINGLFFAGPFAAEQRSQIQQWVEDANQQLIATNDYLAGLSVVGDCVVGRYLGACSEHGRELFVTWWKALRPLLLKRFACPPRIWLT